MELRLLESMFMIRLNNELNIADISIDRRSYDAWRRYTVEARGIDMVSVSLFCVLRKVWLHRIIAFYLV